MCSWYTHEDERRLGKASFRLHLLSMETTHEFTQRARNSVITRELVLESLPLCLYIISPYRVSRKEPDKKVYH